MARFQKRAPSGNILTASWRGKDIGSHVCGVRYAGGSVGRGFQIHPRGAHDAAMRMVEGPVIHERVLVGRNEVKVSTATDVGATTATLIGRHHELMTVFTGPAPARERIAAIFGVLDINDHPHGMRVAPTRASMLSLVSEHIVFVADDFTSMDAPGAPSAQRLVPRGQGRGKKTQKGEVWKSKVPGRSGNKAHDFAYIVGTPRGAVELVAGAPAEITETALLEMVDTMDVTWSAG